MGSSALAGVPKPSNRAEDRLSKWPPQGDLSELWRRLNGIGDTVLSWRN